MNAAQKIIQPLIDMSIRTKELDWGEIVLRRASDCVASISLLDFATLDQVPAVEWKFHEADDECTYRWSHNEWLVCPSYDANGIISMYAVSFGYSSPHYWNTEAQAKRYAEIKLHTLELQRKLIAELAGGK